MLTEHVKKVNISNIVNQYIKHNSSSLRKSMGTPLISGLDIK